MKNAPKTKSRLTTSEIKRFLVEDIGLEYVLAFIIVVILTPFVIKILVPYFNPTHRIREPSSASAECSSIGITVERISSSKLYRDEGVTPTPEGMYSGYRIRNETGAAIDKLWAGAGNFTGSYISLAPNEDGTRNLGMLQNGEDTYAYFYFVSSDETNNTENHLISLYENDPAEGGDALCSTTFLLTAEETIKANANKVNSVTYSPSTPELGGEFVMTITGETGIIGDEKVFAFTPASYPAWPADAFELTNVMITLAGGNTGTYHNTLFLDGLTSTHTNYTISYTFEVKSPEAGNSPISPQSYISSGMRTKHTNTKDDTYISLVPVLPPENITVVDSKDASETDLTDGGTITFTLQITNSGFGQTILDRIVDTLPTDPDTTSYVPGSSSLNGNPISDPVIAGNILTWSGEFHVEPGGPTLLSYDVFFPATAGTYINSAAGFIGATRIDTTADTGDNVPAEASLSVDLSGVSPEDPDSEPDVPAPEPDEEGDEALLPDEEEQQEPDQDIPPEAPNEEPDEIGEQTDVDEAQTDGNTDITQTESEGLSDQSTEMTEMEDGATIAQTEDTPDEIAESTEIEEEDTTENPSYDIGTTGTDEAGSEFYSTYNPVPSSIDMTDQQNKVVTGLLSAATVSGIGAFLLVVFKPSNPMGVRIGGYSLTLSQKLKIAQRLHIRYYRMDDIYMEDIQDKQKEVT